MGFEFVTVAVAFFYCFEPNLHKFTLTSQLFNDQQPLKHKSSCQEKALTGFTFSVFFHPECDSSVA